MARDYGRQVTRTEANRHYKMYANVKTRAREKIRAAMKGDSESLRYYTGDDGTGLKEDTAYIFDKNSLKKILDMLNKGEADGVAVFNGIRAKSDSVDPVSGGFSDVDGRPTLLIFPYKNKPSAQVTEPDLQILLDDGSEHPGTGGGGTRLNGSATQDDELPEVFTSVQVLPFI